MDIHANIPPVKPQVLDLEAECGLFGRQPSEEVFPWDQLLGFLGVATLLAWLWALLFSTGSLNAFVGTMGRGAAQALHTVGLIAGLLVVVARKPHLPKSAGRHVGAVVFSIPYAAIAGVVLTGWGEGSTPIAATLWLLCGFACSSAIIDSACFLNRYSPRTILALLSGAGICAAATALLFAFLASEAKTACTCALLPCSLFLFSAAFAKESPAGRAIDATESTPGAAREWLASYFDRCAPFALGLALYGSAYGFVCSLGNNLYADTVGPASAFAAMLVPNAILLACALSARRQIGMRSLQSIAAVTAISFLPMLFLGDAETEAMRIAAHMVLLACVNGFFTAAFTLQIEAARSGGIGAVRAYALGQLFHFSGLAIGWMAGMAVFEFAGLGSTTLHCAAACLIAALIIAAVSFGRRTDAEAGEAEGEREFARKAAAISKEFELSKRESEVFSLIAQGYDNQSIEQELFISKNTVKTHVYHIYAKLGVHSKEELADLVKTARTKAGRTDER